MALFQPEPLGIKVDLEKKVDDLVENNKNLEHRIAALENLIIKLQKSKTRKSHSKSKNETIKFHPKSPSLPKGPYKPMKKNITKSNSNSNSKGKSKGKSKNKSNSNRNSNESKKD